MFEVWGGEREEMEEVGGGLAKRICRGPRVAGTGKNIEDGNILRLLVGGVPKRWKKSVWGRSELEKEPGAKKRKKLSVDHASKESDNGISRGKFSDGGRIM